MPQERLYRTEGIVLRELDYARDRSHPHPADARGKLSALAKGIRRATSRKVAILGLFYRVTAAAGRGA